LHLGSFAEALGFETAEDVLEEAYSELKTESHSLADEAYGKLKNTMPKLPAVRSSKGDLWLENYI
jgi:hypothetical protein